MFLTKERRESRLMLLDLVDKMGKVCCALFGYLIDVVAAFLYVSNIISVLAVHEVETDVCIGTISDRSRWICMRKVLLILYPKKSLGQFVETLEEGSSLFWERLQRLCKSPFGGTWHFHA